MRDRLVDNIFRATITMSREQISERISGSFIVMNRITQNESPQLETHSTVLIADIDGGLLQNLLENIQQSNAELSIEDVEWVFLVTTNSQHLGGSAIQIPGWAKIQQVKDSFKKHTFTGIPINCGAFCIASIVTKTPKHYNLKKSIEYAYFLQKRLQWGEFVSKEEVANAFLDLKPEARLTFLRPNHDCQENDTYYGAEWKEIAMDHNPNQLVNTYYIFWSLDRHFGLCSNPQQMFDFYKSGRLFCHKCVTQYPSLSKCRCEDAVKKQIAIKRKQCEFCNEFGCNGCKKKCNFCSVAYSGIENGKEPHRCILVDNKPAKLFLQPGEEPTKRKPKYKLYAFDLESRVQIIEGFRGIKFETANNEFVNTEVPTFDLISEHVPNLVVFRDIFDPNSEQIYFGDDCLERFLDFMTLSNLGRNICVAHNASGYDSRLLLETIIHQFGNTVDKKAKFICRGTKFMQLKWGDTIFLDSLLHLPGSLAGLAKSFNLTMRKGYFPHLFNSTDNYDYNSTLPDKKYFDLTFMAKTKKDVDEFNNWYDVRKEQGPWNFQEELIAYCKDDVKILSEIMMQFHTTIINDFGGESPWFSTTAPAFCHKTVLRHLTQQINLPSENEQRLEKVNDMALNSHWAVLVSNEYWFARKALRGGRTDVRKIYHALTDEEKARGCRIVYQDIVSMYPYVQVARDYPVGLPIVNIYDEDYYPCKEHSTPIRGNVVDLKCACRIRKKRRNNDFRMRIVEQPEPEVNELISRPDFFGYICVHIIPPKNLFHPVLVTWTEEVGKCTAKLEEIKEGVFTTEEFKVAIQKGYKCVKIFRYDQYNRAPGLWKDFILDLYIKKMASSGPPPETEQEKERIVQSYADLFGEEYGNKIRHSFNEWAFRPAARQVYKIMLNSVWGKHCQRPVMPKAQMLHGEDYQEWYDLYANIEAGNTVVTKFVPVGDRFLINTNRSQEQKTYLDFHDSYLPAGAYVPAYGRLMLYEMLDKLGKRVLYHDTDSIIYVYDPLEFNIPMNDIWGTWDEEKISKEGIEEFVSTGPKSYAIKTSKSETVKLKGVSIKHSHRFLINFSTIKKLVFDTLDGVFAGLQIPQYKFNYKIGEGIKTEEYHKSFKFHSTDLKGDLGPDLYVYPKGYQE